MKLITLFCFLIGTNLAIISQEIKKEIPKEGNYIFTSSFQTFSETTFNGTSINTTRTLHNAGSIISVIVAKKDSVVIQYYKSKVFSDTIKKLKETTFNSLYYENNGTLKYYKIDHDDFLRVTTPYYSRYKGASAGFYSVPFKLRFNTFDFEQNLNIGINVGVQYRLNKKIDDRWILEPNFGVGLAKINLNPKNSDVLESRTASAFSLSTGLMLHFSEKINAGYFIGWDFLSNADADVNWIHNQKLWLGLGINIGFSISKSKQSKEKN